MLSVAIKSIMLNVFMQSVIRPSVVMLSVVRLNVVAPFNNGLLALQGFLGLTNSLLFLGPKQ